MCLIRLRLIAFLELAQKFSFFKGLPCGNVFLLISIQAKLVDEHRVALAEVTGLMR
jgi:hypothetical protein